MSDYALIFRRTRPVDPAALPARNTAARDWALALDARGLLRTAAPLLDEGRVVTADGVSPVPEEAPLASVLIVAAESLDAAVELARGHPGLAWGTTLEVRPVKAVRRTP